MKIKAEILDNDRKYYGTEIELSNEWGDKATFVVWANRLSPGGIPSEREIDFVGEDYEYEICDDHYETQTVYNICKVIVDALNRTEV